LLLSVASVFLVKAQAIPDIPLALQILCQSQTHSCSCLPLGLIPGPLHNQQYHHPEAPSWNTPFRVLTVDSQSLSK
jgi:hypothetical protein